MYQTKIYENYLLDTEAEIRGGGSNDRLYLTNNESVENFPKNHEIIGVEQIYAIMEDGSLDVTGNSYVERAGIGRNAKGVNTVILNKGSQAGVVEGIAGATAIFDFQEDIGNSVVVRLEDAQLKVALRVKNSDELTLATEGFSNIGVLEGDMHSLNTTGDGIVKLKLAADSAITTINGDSAFDIDASTITPASLFVRGGKDDDRLALRFAQIDDTYDIDLGEGNNTLAITDLDVDFRLTENIAKLDGLHGITCLEACGVKLIVDQGANYLPMQSYNHYAASNGGSLQITEGMDDLSIHFRYGGGEATVNMSQPESKLNILLEGAGTPARVKADASTFSINSENITAEEEANTLNLSAPGAEISVTGSHNLSLILDNQGETKGFTIEAFDFEAILAITASDGVDEFGLFENRDVDHARFIAAINDFMSGVDKLFGGVAGTAENFLEGGYYLDFDAFLEAADAQFAANDDLVYYTAVVDGNLLIAQDVDDGGTDAVVQLAGVQHISYTDIV